MQSLPDILLPKIRFFGLAIESHAICGVEVNEKRIPIHSAQMQLPEGTFVGGQLQNIDVFTQILKQLVKVGKFTTPYVAVTFPESISYTRGLTVPSVADEELTEAIAWQAKDLFPFPAEEIYFDSKVISKQAHDSQVTVVAVQRKNLDPLITALIKSGLKPLRFEPDAMALSRLLKLKSSEQALLVERNTEGAYITLVSGDKSLFTTIVPKTAQDTEIEMEKGTTQSLAEIIQYYQSKAQIGSTTASIVVTGEPISQAWVSQISQTFHLPAKILKTQFGKSVIDKAFASVTEPVQPPASIESINLLPATTQAYYDTERHQAFRKALLMRALAIPVMLTITSGILYGMIQIEKNKLTALTAELSTLITSQQTDTKKLLLVNTQAKAIIALSSLRESPAQYIEALEPLLGNDIVITSWSYDDAKLQFTLSGTAKTRTALLEMKDRFENSDLFGKITIPLGTLELPVQVPFTVMFLTKK